jgi:hypothetical protein
MIDEMVNLLYGMLRRAGREMEIRTTNFKVWMCCYDEQYTGKKRKVRVAI